MRTSFIILSCYPPYRSYDKARSIILDNVDSSDGSALLFSPLNGGPDCLTMRADMTAGAIHHNFGRVGAVTETMSITILTLGCRFKRKWVLPA
jgi:hypothetical protein